MGAPNSRVLAGVSAYLRETKRFPIVGRFTKVPNLAVTEQSRSTAASKANIEHRVSYGEALCYYYPDSGKVMSCL
jgi:hypothetical protein